MGVTATANGKWNARYPVGGGKTKNKVFDKKKFADDYHAKMRMMVRGGSYIDEKKGKQLVKVYAWEWFGLQPETPNRNSNVRSHIHNHLEPVLGEQSIGTVTSGDLQKIVSRLQGLGYEATTIRTIMSTIKSIFRSAARNKFIPDDPTIGLKLPRPVRRQIKPITIDQVKAIAAEIFPRYKALVLFTAGTGLRQGEVFAVKVSDITWEKGQGSVRVWQQIQSYTGAAQEAVEGTKGRGERTVPIGDDLLELLHEHIAEYPPNRAGFIFTNTLGKPLHRRVFDRAFKSAVMNSAKRIRAALDSLTEITAVTSALVEADALDLERTVFHGLRHFYASLLIRKGLSAKVVSVRLGHVNAAFTLNVYGHLWPDDDDRTRLATTDLFQL